MRTLKPYLWLMILYIFYAGAAGAEELPGVASSTVSPVSATTSRRAAELDTPAQNARDWGLTPEEWARFRQLMHGPLGVYSPNLDPLTALGTEARSESERKHIAELQVQMEAQRVQKLFAYQRAYDAAWKRAFPSIQPFSSRRSAARTANNSIESAGGSTGVSGAPGDPARLAVFVKEDCPLCDQRVKDLSSAGTAFDLYMVGTRGDDERIRAWAARMKIDPNRVRAGTITLNHDGGRWFSIGLPGSLPAVLHSVNGQWMRE